MRALQIFIPLDLSKQCEIIAEHSKLHAWENLWIEEQREKNISKTYKQQNMTETWRKDRGLRISLMIYYVNLELDSRVTSFLD